MKNILRVDSPNVYARFVDAPVLHPLVSVIHYDELAPFRHSLNNYGVYGLFIQRQFPLNLSYGMRKLQVSDGSIIAVEPGQIGGLEDNGERISLCGWVLLWSPELLHGSELERQIDRYQFFSYFFDGSLRMEPDEWLCITQPGVADARGFAVFAKSAVGLSASDTGILQPHLPSSNVRGGERQRRSAETLS